MKSFSNQWSNAAHQILSHYLSSLFVGHSAVGNIVESFLEAPSKMKMPILLQVSMNGFNINWSFLEKLSFNHHDGFSTTILFHGSCDLHIINGALKIGHATVKWKV